MEELYEILEDIIPGEDYKNSTALVDDDILTSFELVRLVTEIDSTFDISIPSSEDRCLTILIQRKPSGR